jgi:hypothetical protein
VHPAAQRRLAALLAARALPLAGGHMGLSAAAAGRFRDALLETVLVGDVLARAGAQGAAAGRAEGAAAKEEAPAVVAAAAPAGECEAM